MDGQGHDNFLRSIRQIRRLFTVGIVLMVVFWSAVLPAMIMWGRYKEAHSLAQVRLEQAAGMLSSFVASHLDTWEFQSLRVPSLVEEALPMGAADIFWLELRDVAGRQLLAQGVQGAYWPALSVAEEVTDGRHVVAYLRAQVSLRGALAPAVLGAAIGVAMSLVLLLLVRLLARRALDRALNRVEDTTARLQEQVAELQRTRSELAAQLSAREVDRQLLARHAANLAMANQDLTHVAQLAAHHLQEPLRTVLAFSQLLISRTQGDEGSDGDPAECVSFIRAGTRRMQTQLSALSTYLGLREAESGMEAVALNDILAELKVRLEPELRAMEASLEWGELPEVHANRHHIQMLFHDLVRNALRHHGPDAPAHVTVSAREHEQGWLLSVADNGMPLESRDPERMFHLLVHDEDGAMGVGLAPCRRIVHMLGGTIRADRREGGGAVISLTLPRRSAGAV
ncbi:MAG: ATP-binding protein [Magnetospirillum sp.]|nr:ATP-binding protein [Magnetospirillum sp.]